MVERRTSDGVEILGQPRRYWGDWYQLLLRMPWRVSVLLIAGLFLSLNLLFATGYQIVGGISGAHSFSDRFFFSVQTLGTIGYGAMYPSSLAAHALTTCEAIAGIFVAALTTGLVFSKFSMVRARVRFCESVVIAPMDGVPTVMVRLGNDRESRVVDVSIRVMLSRREHTAEGVDMWRLHDLRLQRQYLPVLARGWLVMHVIDESSPLHGCTAEVLAALEAELLVSVSGTDETSGQTLHAQQTYEDQHIRWNARYADMLGRRSDGTITMDLSCFDEVVDLLAPTAD
jgi:inward rectifier potassium channel